MIDSEYFRTVLQAHVDDVGGEAYVEVHVVSGRAHQVRSVSAVDRGYVTLEVYRRRSEGGTGAERWRGDARDAGSRADTRRAIIAYESIVDVTITPKSPGGPTIGFA